MPNVPAIVRYSHRFEKEFSRAPLKVKKAFRKRRELFLFNPSHPQLRDHTLSGVYAGYRSLNVTGDWRALYVEQAGSNGQRAIIFKAIGTHSQLYR